MSADYARFQETFVKLGKLLESANNWDEARAKLLLHTDSPAYDPEFLRFLDQLEDQLNEAGSVMFEPFHLLYLENLK